MMCVCAYWTHGALVESFLYRCEERTAMTSELRFFDTRGLGGEFSVHGLRYGA